MAPVSEVPLALSKEIPQVYVSREVCKHIEFDVTLLGDCDVVVAELVRRLGWKWGQGQQSMVGVEKDVHGARVECRDEEKAWWNVVKA